MIDGGRQYGKLPNSCVLCGTLIPPKAIAMCEWCAAEILRESGMLDLPADVLERTLKGYLADVKKAIDEDRQ